MIDAEAKRERQRQHVKRSYYRKLERIKSTRCQVEQLTQQHRMALACQHRLLQQQDYDPNAHNADGQPRQRAAQLYVEASRLKEQLQEENQRLRKLLDEKESLRMRIQNACDDYDDLRVQLTASGSSFASFPTYCLAADVSRSPAACGAGLVCPSVAGRLPSTDISAGSFINRDLCLLERFARADDLSGINGTASLEVLASESQKTPTEEGAHVALPRATPWTSLIPALKDVRARR